MNGQPFQPKSHWMTTRGYTPGPSLDSDVQVDVAIGYMGDKRVVYSIGCMGHGVSLTHLNGQTICDLILENKTDLSDVFFVDRKTIPWPPDPFRTLGAKAIVGYMHWEDRAYDPK